MQLNQIFGHTEDFQTQELTELRHIDPALDSVSDVLTDDDTGRDMNEMLVRMMNAALRHWEGTGKTKVDLAEESGMWKAYLDKGTWKTPLWINISAWRRFRKDRDGGK
ncbi:MAG: hypothetical protein C4518_12250 [Desulfobacteraceae bacterium]|nr:MAG: hypothetical protein C4518_12250 [Desulfobacteraceae bacterium]